MKQQESEKANQPERDDWYERRHHRDSTSAIFGGIFLILLGVLLFLASQGILAWDKWWQYFIVGIGTIMLIDGLVRYRKESIHRFRVGRIIGGIILIGIGLAFLLGAVTWWPLILILVGIGVIIGGILRSRQR